MKRIITYGTFDLLHYGHINLLKRARELGDHLTVALSTDHFNARKGKQAFHNYADRATLLNAIRYVEAVIPEADWEQKIFDVERLKIDVFVMGDDWQGKFDFLKEHCEVVYLPRTPDISTTEIKARLRLVETI